MCNNQHKYLIVKLNIAILLMKYEKVQYWYSETLNSATLNSKIPKQLNLKECNKN